MGEKERKRKREREREGARPVTRGCTFASCCLRTFPLTFSGHARVNGHAIRHGSPIGSGGRWRLGNACASHVAFHTNRKTIITKAMPTRSLIISKSRKLAQRARKKFAARPVKESIHRQGSCDAIHNSCCIVACAITLPLSEHKKQVVPKGTLSNKKPNPDDCSCA